MKVVKDGKIGDLKNWKMKLVCEKKDKYDEKEGCGAELEITKADILIMYWHGTHFPHYYSAVKCPQCGKYIETGGIPKPLWEELATPKNKADAIFDGFSQEI